MELTSAAWLEGIPPVRQITVSNTSLTLRRRPSSITTVLISWAINQLKRDDKKTGFSKKAFNGAALREIAGDIV
jgi:hypothetical protein